MTDQPKILVIGPASPPVHGVSVMTETAVAAIAGLALARHDWRSLALLLAGAMATCWLTRAACAAAIPARR